MSVTRIRSTSMAVRLLSDADRHNREAAQRYIVRNPSGDGIAGLIDGLSSDDPTIRSSSALALSGIEGAAGFSEMAECMISDPSAHVRLICTWVMGSEHYQAPTALFVSALNDSDAKVVSAACAHLQAVHATEAIPAIEALLIHENRYVRLDACDSLIAMGRHNRQVLSTLMELAALGSSSRQSAKTTLTTVDDISTACTEWFAIAEHALEELELEEDEEEEIND